MQIIPVYKIEVELDQDKPNILTYYINAMNVMEATQWFNKLNWGLTPIHKLTIEIDGRLENSLKSDGAYQK